MSDPSTPLPRVTIQFCTQCKWMLRAAYFAQELLSTFSTSLGEVALQPSTGGTFIVNLYTAATTSTSSEDGEVHVLKHLLWDRKAEGGFPETKELKRRVRDVIDPNRDLGHVDGKKSTPSQPPHQTQSSLNTTGNTSIPASSTSSKPTLPQAAMPRAINRLQSASTPIAERKFTPMDIDTRPLSSSGPTTHSQASESKQGQGQEEEVLNSRGKIQIGGGGGEEGFGYCRPGEDCEDCG